MNSSVPPSASEREKSEEIKQAPLWIFPLVLAVMAMGGFFIAAEQMENYNKQIDAAERFVPVPAKVLEARVKAVRHHSGGSNNNKTGYVPHIRYRYEVDGKGYKRSRYAYFHVNFGRGDAQSIVDRYEVGAMTTAYIDPDNSKRAVLNAEPPKRGWFMIGFFIAFAGIIAIVGWFAFKQWRARAHHPI